MRSVYRSVWIVFCAVLCIVAVTRNAAAEEAAYFLDPTGWSIGDANSTYQEWDVFTATAGNVPDIGRFPDLPTPFAPTFSAESPGYRSATTSNIYSYAGDYNWWADIDNYGVGDPEEGTRLIVQIAATLNDGVGVYPDSLAVVQPNGDPISGGAYSNVLQDTTLSEREIYIPALDDYAILQERLWEFYLPGYFGDFRVEGTSSIHSSLMQVQVDSMISPVPEPGAIVLVGTGLIALGACRMIRRIRRRPRSV